MGRRAWFVLACAILIPWQLYHVATHPQFYRPPLPIGDGPDYETIGYSLSIGNGFAFAWNDPQWKAPYLEDVSADQYPHLNRDKQSGTTTTRPPLVPLVLATIYRSIGRDANSFAAFRCLSALSIGLAGSLAVLIAFDVSSKIALNQWTSHWASVATLIFALFDRTIRTYAIDFLSEPLALFWTTAFLYLGLRLENTQRRNVNSATFDRRNTIASGSRHRGDSESILANHLPSRFPLVHYRLSHLAPVGLAAICMAAMIATRSMFVFWMPGIFIVLFLSLKRNSRPATLTFVVVVVLLLCPWWIRNCQRLESFMPMGAQGAVSILGGYSDEALADQGNWHPEAQNRLQQKLLSLPGAKKWSSLELEREMALAASAETRYWVRQHARDIPTLIFLRLKTHWSPYFGKSLIWRCGMLLGVVVLLMHRRWESYWFLGIPIVSSLTVMGLYETGGRFLVPLYGLLYALAGIGFAIVFAKLFYYSGNGWERVSGAKKMTTMPTM